MRLSHLLGLATAVCLLASSAVSSSAAAQTVVTVNRNVNVLSGLGGKCLDVEGGRTSNGTRIIGYPCNGGGTQEFWFNRDGSINHAGKCVVVQGGQGRDNDQLVLWDCNGGANEKWRMSNGRILGQNDKCIDLKGGSWGNLPFVNQPAILYACNGQDNQRWLWAVKVPKTALSGANVIASGALGMMRPIPGVVAAGGANVVAAGGANVVAAGGANVVAAGGLN
jgi:hypothetical protein